MKFTHTYINKNKRMEDYTPAEIKWPALGCRLRNRRIILIIIIMFNQKFI